MGLTRFGNPREFLSKAESFLLLRESENNLILGNALALAKEPAVENGEAYFAVVEQSGRILGAACQTAGRPLVITRMPNDCLSLIVDDRLQYDSTISGLVGPRRSVEALRKLIEPKTGGTYALRMHQLLYELTSVNDLPLKPGSLRQAQMEDASLLTEFMTGFVRDALPNDPLKDFSDLINHRIAAGQMYVWVDGRIVSMAGWAGKTPNGVRINAVYTPPEFRNRGYATSCVATLSGLMLSQGRTFCCLYADQTNPTSNIVYGKIGYVPIGKSTHYVLNEKRKD